MALTTASQQSVPAQCSSPVINSLCTNFFRSLTPSCHRCLQHKCDPSSYFKAAELADMLFLKQQCSSFGHSFLQPVTGQCASLCLVNGCVDRMRSVRCQLSCVKSANVPATIAVFPCRKSLSVRSGTTCCMTVRSRVYGWYHCTAVASPEHRPAGRCGSIPCSFR